MSSENKVVKYACYTANITMSVVASISPVLFLTFRSLYGISYSLLGTLILINFFTQLIVDLLLSFFSHKLNIPKTVKAIPFIAAFGFCVSMLWPGNLIVASSRFPAGGVFIYALMAAGGDLGASVAPQLVGIITDAVIESPKMILLAENLSLAPEQLGMKIALLCAALFPILAVFVNLRFCKKK